MNRKIIYLGITGLLLALILLFIFTRPNYEYPTGRDTYVAFGDGRFQMLRGGAPITISLFDEKGVFEEQHASDCLIGDIEKYIEKDGYIYIDSYYFCSVGKKNDGSMVWGSYETTTREAIRYFSLDEIPRYIILNYETGDIQLYKNLDEVSEEDREIFEKDLGWFCKLRRTCYEKSVD